MDERSPDSLSEANECETRCTEERGRERERGSVGVGLGVLHVVGLVCPLARNWKFRIYLFLKIGILLCINNTS